MQRLLEIDPYRILALLALPQARELTPFPTRCEAELAEITTALVTLPVSRTSRCCWPG